MIGLGVKVNGFTSAGLSIPYSDSLVGFWKGNGNGNDELGLNNVTSQNGATYDTGLTGQAFSLDGVNDYFDGGVDKFNFTSDHTISMWVKTGANVISQKTLIQNYNYNLGSIFSGWQIFTYNSNFGYTWGSTGGAIIYNATSITTNTWYHVAVTWKSGEQKWYLNNSLDGTSFSVVAQSNGLTNNFCLGVAKYMSSFFYYHEGLIQYCRIYNDYKDASFISNLYNSGTPI